MEMEPASFRDPLGHIAYKNGRVIRRLSADGSELWREFRQSGLYDLLLEKGDIVATTELNENGLTDSSYPLALEHERIGFISYACEWPFEMLKDAALFTLDVLLESMRHGFVLRDASSRNVQFQNGRPVFIDVLSFGRLEEGRPWIGYAQYCRQFLFPLMLASHKGVNYAPWLKGSIDGISLDDMAGVFGWHDFYKAGVLFQVLLQHRLNRRSGGPQTGGIKKERLELVIKQLRNATASLMSPFKETAWTRYGDAGSYADAEKEIKTEFVKRICLERHRSCVWDIGANTGEYAQIAAKNAGIVIAMDSDPGVMDSLYRGVKGRGFKNIMPIMCDVADPSSGYGWRNRETKTLPERVKPELVLALALVHHLCISRNIGLRSFVDWLTGLGDEGVVEFVTKDDAMVQKLLANREDIFRDYSRQNFESLLGATAKIVERVEVSPGRRYIYRFRTA